VIEIVIGRSSFIHVVNLYMLQRDLEFALLENHGVKMVRKTLYQLATESTYRNDETKELLLPLTNTMGQQSQMVEAGVVYYRAGYTPDDYHSSGSDVEWTGRRTVEHSAAIKCPDVFYHLVGAKKIQQALAEPGVLRQFCASGQDESLLQSSFAGLYALGEGDDSGTIQKALEHPEQYVLKPQREGGGNNLYNGELVEALNTMSYPERGAYILMQKIVPPPTRGQLVRGGSIVYDGDCVCELGIYSVTLRDYADPNRILVNDVVGHMLRTKSTATDEGGVAAGYAFLSSPHLI
jgi:glutathione synthase